MWTTAQCEVLLMVPPTLMCCAFQQFIAHLDTPGYLSNVFISMPNQLAAELSFCHTENENDICLQIWHKLSNTDLWGRCRVSPIMFERRGTEIGHCETDISFSLDGVDVIHHYVATVEFKKNVNESTRDILYAYGF